MEFRESFDDIDFIHVPRADNSFADALATLAAAIKFHVGEAIPLIKIETRHGPAHCAATFSESDQLPWYHDVKRCMQTGDYPENATSNDRKTLRRLASQFFLCGEVLFKRALHDPLRCIDAPTAKGVMDEVHQGVCGPYMNGHSLAKKIIRTG